MAVTEYAKFRSDTELRELYRQREKTRHDILSYTKTMVRKGREEGIEIGIAKGHEKGLAEGIEKGLAEGIEKGRVEGHEEGLAEGLAKGEEKALTNLLLQAVESRFGKTKASFQKKIRAIKDPAVVLKLLTVTIPAAQTIKDVEKAIPR